MRIYWATKAPHLISNHIIDRLTIKEIQYKTFFDRFISYFSKEKKKPCPNIPFDIGMYGLDNYNYLKIEVEVIESYQFEE